MKKIQNDRRGLSLIELVVAMAILSIITATIGGAMVVATHSYRQGTVESSLQQESQFTANLIESLIVDATKSVVAEPAIVENPDGSETFPTTTKLTITNEGDNYYVINYDGKKLTYNEYAGGTLVNAEENELLADHVSDFKVDARNFASARNVLLTIAMKNENSEYTTSYNVTSRNNPNGGNSGVTAKTTINCAPEIVMEPGQKYVLPVTVLGSSNTYTAAFSSSVAAGSSLNVTSSGLEIILDKNERGGGTDGVHASSPGCLTISLTAQYAETKVVTVYLRYVDKIAGKELNGSGAPSATEYTVNLSDIGFVNNASPSGVEECTNGYNLSQRVTFSSDMGDYDYVDPIKVRWEVAPSAAEYVDVKNWDQYGDSITFTIKKQLPAGATSTLFNIYALHPNGTENGTAMNKAAKYSVARANASDDGHYRTANAVVGHVTYTVPNNGGSDLARGRLGYFTLFNGDNPSTYLEKATVDMLKAKDPTTYGSLTTADVNVESGLIKSYRFFARFKNVNDATDTSLDYNDDMWRTINPEGGVLTGSKTYGKVRQQDFLQNGCYMKFMATYDVEIVTAVYYEYKLNGNGTAIGTWYPAEFNDINGGGQNALNGLDAVKYTGSENIVSMTMEPMSFEYSYIMRNWTKVSDADFNALLSALPGKDGLGSPAKPLMINKNNVGEYQFRIEAEGSSIINDPYGMTGGAFGISSMINKDKGPNPVLVNCSNTSLTYPVSFQYAYDWDNNSDGPTDTIVNGAYFWLSSLPSVPLKDADGNNITYRIEFNKFNGKGWEYYNAENEADKVAGKGQIYIQIYE